MKFPILLILLGAVLLSTASNVHGRPGLGPERERWNQSLPAPDRDYFFSESRAWDTGLITETVAWTGPFEWCRPTVPPGLRPQRDRRLLRLPCEPAANPASPRDPPRA